MSTDPGNLDVTTGAGSALPDLLARVEAAEGPDRELDDALAAALMGWCFHPRDRQRDDGAQSDSGYTCLDCGADSWGNTGPSGQKRHASTPSLTASLDAALGLVERVLPDWWALIDTRGAHARLTHSYSDAHSDAAALAQTPALALLAAMLKALIATGNAEPAQVENPGPGIT